jgi:hypothetical protein
VTLSYETNGYWDVLHVELWCLIEYLLPLSAKLWALSVPNPGICGGEVPKNKEFHSRGFLVDFMRTGDNRS